MNQPTVSIITVSLNAAAFIEDTIRSVLSQTYPALEYIIIDGGSTDGTVETIRKYDSRLAYWHSRRDRGLAHAFNLGLAQARGDWLVYLNADDYFQGPEVVEGMAPQLQAHADAEVVFGQVALIPRRGLAPGESPAIYGGPWRWQRFRFVCTIPHQAAFTRRRYFDRVGSFNEDLALAMDYEHYLRAGPGLAAVFVPQMVSVMRGGGASLNNVIPTLREWRLAQSLNRAANPVLIWGNFLARSSLCLIRQKLGRLLRGGDGRRGDGSTGKPRGQSGHKLTWP